MHIRIKLITGLLFFNIAFGATAQTNEDRIDNLKNVVPPSPNASSLGKYGEWPVSLYTGLPNVSIPIYQLKGKDLTVPISISYHAAGNKVGDIASWIGLGWSLNAGGIITRSIRGLPDEVPEMGFFAKRQLYTNQNDLCSNPINLDQAINHKVQSAKGQSDSEQDLYSFNALGNSFKFFIKSDGTIVPSPYSKIKITTNFGPSVTVPENVFWTVLLEDGTKLQFGGSGFIELNTNPRFDIGASYYPTSWLLKSITSTNGELIDFTYTSFLVDQDSYFSQSDFLKLRLETTLQMQNSPPCQDYVYSYNNRSKSERQQVTMLQVSTIESQLVKVEFINSAADRLDLKGSKSLSEVKIFSKRANQYIDKFKFNHNYSQCITSNEYWGGILEADKDYYRKRLKLISIEKLNPTSLQIDNKWVFNYNPQSLSSRRSFAQDHWGFYNGQVSNTTLLPKYFYPLPSNILQNYNNAGFNAPVYNSGANREGNGNYSQAEILQSIDYPTGGKTTFYFEPNTISVNKEVFSAATTTLAQLNLNAGSSPFTTFSEISFIITVPQNVKIIFDSNISQGIFNDMPNASVTATVRKFGTTNTIGGISSGPGVSQYSGVEHFNIIEPGTYILKISTNVQQESFGTTDAVIASASVEYEQSQGFQVINKNIGGLRLNKIIDYDGVDVSRNIEKSFIYETPLIINPIDIKKLYFTETEEMVCEGSGTNNCHNKVITRNSSTKFSLGDVQGGTVGYGKVTTVYGINGINGKTVTEFNNDNDYGLSETEIWPYPPSDSKEWRRGLLLHQVDYNVSNIKVKEVTNAYEFVYKFAIASFKAGVYNSFSTNPACLTSQCTEIYGNCGIQKVCYNTTSEQVKLLNSVQKVFAPNGNDFTSITTNYFYDNAAYTQATKIEVTNSKNQIVRTDLKYPYDFSGTAVYDEMVNRNIISPVIEQVQTNITLSNKQLSRIKTNFLFWQSNTLIKPATIQKSISGNTLETEATINDYDDKGNMRQMTGKDGVITSYIWGYSQQYPVAKITGKSYTDAVSQSGINLSVVSNPSDENALRTELNNLRTLTGAFATTYTYRPLIGISSETDPRGRNIFYEYDDLNRLVIVRDHDNKILKKICYNYAGQPENCLSPCTNTNPEWQNTTTALRCQVNGSAQNTGYQEQEQKDMNPCSPAYNQLQWITAGYNTTACPLPPACNSSNCTGNDKKCINGVCETGVWGVVSSVKINKTWHCTYRYCFSDGSMSTYSQVITQTTVCIITCLA